MSEKPYVLREPEEEDPLGFEFPRRTKMSILLLGGNEKYREVFHEDPPEDLVSQARYLLTFPNISAFKKRLAGVKK